MEKQPNSTRLQFTDEERANPDLEKAIKKSEKRADKLEKAQNNIPTKKVIKRERTFDETTGESKVRLRFQEVQKPKPTVSNFKKAKEAASVAVISQIHSQISELADDNVGVETLGKSIQASKNGTRLARQVNRYKKEKPYRKLEKADEKSTKANQKFFNKKLQTAPTTSEATSVNQPQQPKPSRLQFTDEERANPDLEKAIKKSEKRADKLKKAQNNIPTKKVIKKERTFDEKTGESKVRLRFQEVQKPKPTVSNFKKAKEAASVAVISQIHSQISELADDNVGAETLGKSIQASENGARLTRQVNRYKKEKPYRKLEKAEEKSTKANNRLEKAQSKSTRANEKFQNKKVQSEKTDLKQQQKNSIKKRQLAKKQAEKTSTSTSQTVITKATDLAKKAVEVVKQAVKSIAKNPVVLAIVGIVLLAVVIIIITFTILFSVFQGALSTTVSTSYLSEETEIIATNNNYIVLEDALQSQLDNIETTYPDYDEYSYDTILIAYDPHELASYLTAKYTEYTADEMQDVIESIFRTQYTLTINEVIETRYETQTVTESYDTVDDDGNIITTYYETEIEVPYDYKTLEISLAGTSLSQIAIDTLTDDEYEHFCAVYACWGNYPTIFGGVSSGYIDYDNLPDVSDSGYMWPTIGAYAVSSEYGYRDASISGWSFHGGMDIISATGETTGTPVIAAKAGTVTVAQSWDKGGYGVYVMIDHGDGSVTLYGHMLEGSLTVTVGQEVEQGEQIGCIGATGNVTGPHLHFEVRIDGTKVDPRYYVGYYED